MAVPKRKTSKSRRDIRRAAKKLKPVFYGFNSTTGELTLPHRVSLDGFYKDRQVLYKKKKEKDENDNQSNDDSD